MPLYATRTSAPTGPSRSPEGSAIPHTGISHLFQASFGHTVKAIAAYHKLVGSVPEKPATSRLFNASKSRKSTLRATTSFPAHTLAHTFSIADAASF